MDSSPFISLNELEKKNIATVVGEQYVCCVEEAILVYAYKEKFYQKQPNINGIFVILNIILWIYHSIIKSYYDYL